MRLADSIDSLDRPKLSDAILRAAEAAGRVPDLLVQVNIGDEAQKSGVPLEDADDFIRDAKSRFGAALKGLMCIPPVGQDPLPFFHKLAALADKHGLAVRSMGMSGDFEAGDCGRGDAYPGRHGDFRASAGAIVKSRKFAGKDAGALPG